MNQNQIMSLLRSVLLAAGAGLVASGKISDGSLQEIIGGILALASVVWSQYHHATYASPAATAPVPTPPPAP